MILFQAFGTDAQKTLVSPACVGLDFRDHPNTREYELYKRLHASQRELHHQPWGLISWSFERKTCLSVVDFASFAARAFQERFDCAFVNPMLANEALFSGVWECGAFHHRGMQEVAAFLERRFGAQPFRTMPRDVFALCNYFVATPAFWSAYFAFVDAALEALEAEVVSQTPAGMAYGSKAAYLRDPNLTLRPFVIERLFSSFLIFSGARAAAFPHSKALYQKKYGELRGDFLYGLSKLRNDALRTNDAQRMRAYSVYRNLAFETQNELGTLQWLDDPPTWYDDPEVRYLLGRSSGSA